MASDENGSPRLADHVRGDVPQGPVHGAAARPAEPDDPLYAWRERMLDLFGGYARQAKGYPVWV